MSEIAKKLVEAVMRAEVEKPGEWQGTRSVGYYFVVGLDHYRMFDAMHDRLIAAAEKAVDAILSPTPTQKGTGR